MWRGLLNTVSAGRSNWNAIGCPS